MGGKIYKYFSPNVLNLVFARDGYIGLKCSLPKDYNDPFELFLGVDINVGAEGLATYREIIFELPQFPTTCFSRSPIVSPMWAHYGQNHAGFVIEFDVKTIQETFPDVAIENVVYRNEPDASIAGSVARVAATKKPRHAVWLQQTVVHHAYFSKYMMWSYEEECRLVDDGNSVENVSNNSILYLPRDCASALVVGKNFPEYLFDKSKGLAKSYGLTWYLSHIGKSLALPFLRDDELAPFVFDGDSIVEASVVCAECEEPFEGDDELCPWCSITEDHRFEAARGNPFRMLEATGGLDEYLAAVREIQKRKR